MITRAAAPKQVKRAGRAVAHTVGRWTADARMTPEFILAGGHRCGTTALHRALIAHPQVAPPVLAKGINYFDVNYYRGPDFYRGHFPLTRLAALRSSAAPKAMEASGYYLDHPFAAERIARDLPAVKLVVMLRDPVERAHSAYRHGVARGLDDVSFEDAIAREADATAGELEKMRRDPTYSSFAWRHQSPVRRGQYVDRLEVFFELLGRDQVHVLFTDDFSTEPERELTSVLEFLGLPQWHPAEFGRWNTREGAPMKPRTRARLENHFAPYDARLSTLLGRELPWRRAI